MCCKIGKSIVKKKLQILLGMGLIILLPTLGQSLSKKDSVQEMEKEKKASRQSLRAFYTAPPVIPHEVTAQRGQKECLYCHKEVLRVGKRISVKTPHPEFFNCQQCHVQGDVKREDSSVTTWKGLEEPKKGTRAHEAAPPTIPHRLFLRKNCNACHGAKNPDKNLRGSHSKRTNCLQCHVFEKKTIINTFVG